MKKTKTQRLILTAMLLAVAVVLALVCEFIPFLHLPFGGGFTIASMLPVVIIAYMFGTRWGLFSAFVYAILQMLMGHSTIAAMFMPQSDSYMILWQALLSIVFDYLIAYTVLGLGGIFRRRMKKTGALCLGSIVAVSLRYLAHIVSGAILYGAWAEWFFTQEGFYAIGEKILGVFSGTSLSIIYSIFYNGLYMVPEIIVTAIAAILISRLPQIGVCTVE